MWSVVSTSGTKLESCHRTVAPRIESAFQRAVRMPDKRAGVAHRLFEISQYFNVMAARPQVFDQRRPDSRLEFQALGRRTPGAAEQPARRTDRALHLLAEDGIAR